MREASDEAAPRAAVYRNLEAPNTLLGLAFPTEWGAVLAAGFLASVAGAPNLGAAVSLGIYAALRIAGRGRPDAFLQHSLLFRARQMWTGGAVSAAARAFVPRFPFGRHEWRESAAP